MINRSPVTGIARGGLGTATNLDDTQLFSLEDLVPEEPALLRWRARWRPRQSRPLLVASGTFAILALATALTLRDADLAGPGAIGGALGGGHSAGTAPPLVTTAPLPTTAPEASGKGHGNGNGHDGDGHGH